MQGWAKNQLLSLVLLICTSSVGLNADFHNSDDRSMATTYADSARLFMIKEPSRAAIYAYQSFEYARKMRGDDEVLLESAMLLTDIDLKTGNNRRVIETLNYITRAITIPLHDTLQLQIYLSRGRAFLQLGSFSAAEKDFLELYRQSEDEGDSSMMAQALINLGTVYIRTGDYDKSLDCNQKSLVTAQKLMDTVSMARIYNNLGGLYAYLSRSDSALEYFRKSYKLQSILGDTIGIMVSLINIASMQREMKNYTEARENDIEALEISRRETNVNYLCQIYEGLGIDYLESRDYTHAEEYLRAALASNGKAKNLYMDAHIRSTLVDVFIRSFQPDSARLYLERGRSEAISLGNKELLMMFARSAADLSVLLGNYRDAYKYLTEYHGYHDSLNNASTLDRISDLEMNYQNNRKEEELQRLRINHEMLELKVKKNRLVRFLLLLLVFIGLVGIFTIGILYRNARHAKRLVQKKNDELGDAIAIKNRLFSIIAHDLKNPLNAIIGFSSLLTEGENSDKQQVAMYAERINSSGLQGFEMIEKLLEWSRLNMDEIHLDQKMCDIHATSVKASENVRNYAATKKISIQNHISPETFAYFDSYSIESVIRNLISNAVKYSEEDSRVDLFCEEKGKSVIVCVHDHGLGIPYEYQENILNPSIIVSLPGSKNEKGTGLGLTLSKEFVERNHGRIWFHSVPGEGTSFFFSLPLNPLQ